METSKREITEGLKEAAFEMLIRLKDQKPDATLYQKVSVLAGMPEIGTITANIILKKFNYKFENLLNASLDQIKTIPGVTHTRAKVVFELMQYCKERLHSIEEKKSGDREKKVEDELEQRLKIVRSLLRREGVEEHPVLIAEMMRQYYEDTKK